MLYNASHGSLGGIPRYNDSWRIWAAGENSLSLFYDYTVDRENSIIADKFIRGEAESAGIVIPFNPLYPSPLDDPDWPDADD